MSKTNPPTTTWRKSSRSSGQGGQCVEVAALTSAVGIRDSKNPTLGHLTMRTEDFDALITRIKRGELDRD
ncbi:DUF397 domain-containing protein [Actinomadura craniellae]|uniref:DUF397 domain-containing protein n=1 Tax=Actinomadura craniellae TaxID=2231787 RepID=A0A365H1B9_9ACTN|nr:DUF397 domain-containing protein [Actinomadura craniellae]RAY12877.1 DUF397 domain-containing protein [Actinomadura craniellae]